MFCTKKAAMRLQFYVESRWVIVFSKQKQSWRTMESGWPSSDLVKSDVEIRWYRDEKWKRIVPLGLENPLLMGLHGLGRLVRVVSDVEYVDHGVCRARSEVQTIRWPGLVDQSWLWFTALLLPTKCMEFRLPQSNVKQTKLPFWRPEQLHVKLETETTCST